MRGTKPRPTPQATAADKRSSSRTTSNPTRPEPGDQEQDRAQEAPPATPPEAPLTAKQARQIATALEGASKLLQAFQNNPNDKQRLENAITNAQGWEALRRQCKGLHWQKKSAFQRLLTQLEAMSKWPIDRRLIASIEDPALSRVQLLVDTFNGEEDADRDRLLAGLQYVVGEKGFQAPAKDKKSGKAFLKLQALILALE